MEKNGFLFSDINGAGPFSTSPRVTGLTDADLVFTALER